MLSGGCPWIQIKPRVTDRSEYPAFKPFLVFERERGVGLDFLQFSCGSPGILVVRSRCDVRQKHFVCTDKYGDQGRLSFGHEPEESFRDARPVRIEDVVN